MKQGIFIALIVVILVVAGYFFLTERESDENEVNLTATQIYFAQEIQASSIKRIGQPIEGFEPQILMQAFPRIIHTDFDGVQSQQGEFQVSNGAIAFVFTDLGPEHSAARAITEGGMRTLLENVGARLGLPFETIEDVDVIISEISGPSIEESLVGLWESTDDEKFTREFEADGTSTDRYEGDELATFVGEWVTFNDPSSEPVEIPVIEGATYLRILSGEETLYFTVSEITEDSLQLIYLDRGGALNFRKITE
jgi:hypothetical protein